MVKQGSRTAFLILLGFLVVGFGYLMQHFWESAALALITAMVLRPTHSHIERWCRGRRYIAAFIAVWLTGAFLLLPLGSVVATILVESIRFSRDLTALLQQGQLAQSLDAMNAWMLGLVPPVQEWLGPEWSLRTTLLSLAQEVGHVLYTYSPRFFLSTANIGLKLILWVLFLFVLFAEGPALYHYFMELSPISQRHERYIAGEVRGMVSAVFLGLIATSLVNAVLMTIAFAIVGIDRPLMWGLMTFGFSFVPVIGALTIWGGAAIYLLLIGAWPAAIGMGLYGLLIISQADNIVKPLVMRGRVKVHPVLLLLSILGGVQAMGPVGLILGPVFIAIFLAVLHIYREEFQGTEKERI